MDMRRLLVLAGAALLVSLSGCLLFLASDDVLYEETFSDASGSAWYSGATPSFDKWVDSGKYYVLVKTNATTANFDATAGPFGNAQFDADIDHVLGTPDQSSGGLAFRATDINNFYAFMVSAVGSFSVMKWVNGVGSTLLAWAITPAVHKGVARNHLTVIADGPSLSFFANGTEVAMLTDTSLSSGTVGVVVKAFSAEIDVLEAFDNITVTALDE